jgi:hypothetical protein
MGRRIKKEKEQKNFFENALQRNIYIYIYIYIIIILHPSTLFVHLICENSPANLNLKYQIWRFRKRDKTEIIYI